MKKQLLILIFLFGFLACNENTVRKPENLIKKEVLIEIITDLAVLEAIQSHNPALLELHHINPYQYVYKKYEIDSLQLAESNIYYASNIKEYDAIYEKVKIKLEQQKADIDSSFKEKSKESETPLNIDTVSSQKLKKLEVQ